MKRIETFVAVLLLVVGGGSARGQDRFSSELETAARESLGEARRLLDAAQAGRDECVWPLSERLRSGRQLITALPRTTPRASLSHDYNLLVIEAIYAQLGWSELCLATGADLLELAPLRSAGADVVRAFKEVGEVVIIEAEAKRPAARIAVAALRGAPVTQRYARLFDAALERAAERLRARGGKTWVEEFAREVATIDPTAPVEPAPEPVARPDELPEPLILVSRGVVRRGESTTIIVGYSGLTKGVHVRGTIVAPDGTAEVLRDEVTDETGGMGAGRDDLAIGVHQVFATVRHPDGRVTRARATVVVR